MNDDVLQDFRRFFTQETLCKTGANKCNEKIFYVCLKFTSLQLVDSTLQYRFTQKISNFKIVLLYLLVHWSTRL